MSQLLTNAGSEANTVDRFIEAFSAIDNRTDPEVVRRLVEQFRRFASPSELAEIENHIRWAATTQLLTE